MTIVDTLSDTGDCCRAALTAPAVLHLAHTTAAVEPMVAPLRLADAVIHSQLCEASGDPFAALYVYSAVTGWSVWLSEASLDAFDLLDGFVVAVGVPAALGGPCVTSLDAFEDQALAALVKDGALLFALNVAATVVPDVAEVD